MNARTKFPAWLIGLALVIHAASGAAQEYPSKPIRILVGVPAGTGPDVETRQFASLMTAQLGQQVIVENRPGNSGVIATQVVAKSAPDGYTLLSVQPGFASSPQLYDRAGIDINRDLAPISLLGKHPWVLYVHPSIPARTVGEFVALAKSQPDRFSFGTRGVGSFNHLTGELFQSLSGTRLKHVPYSAGNPANDLLGGHVPMAFGVLPPAMGNLSAGTLRSIAVLDKQRFSLLPNIPTSHSTTCGAIPNPST